MTVEEVADPGERSAICERILRALPEWFGIEEATRAYIDAVADLDTLVVRNDNGAVGFVSLKRHTPHGAEVYVIGVLPEHHRSGVGRALIAAAEERLARDGVEFLQVKTLGPSRPSEGYERTRAFYDACGFRPLEEIHGLWDEANPCLLMVKHLDAAPPPPALLWGLMRGALTTQALRLAAEFHVADALADGPRAVADVAVEAGADADALHRFLRALASEGVFSESARGVFRNTPASELLRTTGDERWHEFSLQFGDEWYQALAEAAFTARTGTPSFPRVFGASFEEWLQANPERLDRFGRSMEGGAAGRVQLLVDLEWEPGAVVVDVGGGTGSTLIGLLARHPELRGVVYDLPDVAAQAAERIATVGLADRCEAIGGNFFGSVPAGDAYVLSRILHGCSDESAAAVLGNIRAAARPGAGVVILDAVLPEGNEPHPNTWLDLLMLVLSGGRERTEAEWRRLLDGTGLQVGEITDGLVRASCP